MIAVQTIYRHHASNNHEFSIEQNIVKPGVATSGDTAIHISIKLVLSIEFYFSRIINH